MTRSEVCPKHFQYIATCYQFKTGPHGLLERFEFGLGTRIASCGVSVSLSHGAGCLPAHLDEL